MVPMMAWGALETVQSAERAICVSNSKVSTSLGWPSSFFMSFFLAFLAMKLKLISDVRPVFLASTIMSLNRNA